MKTNLIKTKSIYLPIYETFFKERDRLNAIVEEVDKEPEDEDNELEEGKDDNSKNYVTTSFLKFRIIRQINILYKGLLYCSVLFFTNIQSRPSISLNR